MIERLYVHNYRCLENFTLDLKGKGSALLIGKNGSGKSTVRQALGVLQKIGRGPNRVKEWVDDADFAQRRLEAPMRIALESVLDRKRFAYSIAFQQMGPTGPHVFDETLTVDNDVVFSRQRSEVTLPGQATYHMDPGVAALPVIWAGWGNPIARLKSFLASIVLIAPVPALMSGYSERGTSELDSTAANISAWLDGLLLRVPAAYADVVDYIRSVIPDFDSVTRQERNGAGGELRVAFKSGDTGSQLTVDFGRLSDGEKCFFLSAIVTAYAKHAGPVFCFWDEPDNHLSLPEVGHFILELRRIANQGGQFVATTHNPEAIRRFSAENTLVLTRNSHLEPTLIRPLSEITYSGDLINALIRDEVIG